MQSLISIVQKATDVALGSWKDVGGAAIAFQALKFYVFGKSIRTIEYPNGQLKTVVLRQPTLAALRTKISGVNDLHPAEVTAVSKWMAPHFCEPLNVSKEVRGLPDDGWVIWAKAKQVIPTRLSLDKGFPMGDPFQDSIYKIVQDLHGSKKTHLQISEQERDELVMLATTKDEGLILLYRYFCLEPERFRHLCRMYLERRQKESKTRMAKKSTKGKGAKDEDETDAGADEARRKEYNQETMDSVAAAR
mmetsp:Transcript_40387/g.65491  ORF Transcript_40387/g.65491 Transcript_40387/m.65491 type:complete len:248 (+) Transcript_40387:215-958(+)|eukprot:CAMPEP_0184672370 /NCGR_PEP_ID=MMETSP0308-20130426/86061_1 /TAXON_ID=38269 /ORGANISM="Gloeochaete witrockiana, Strain SAG 46.84" /LENGTH=247 /DNA_ID=CAMNT_0027119691 /DNA_START=160 /DNA_END=903 /DNA_ORIENTATION=+